MNIEAFLKEVPAPAVEGSGSLNEHASEHELANLLQAQLPPFRCVGSDWYVYRNGVWEMTTPDEFKPLAMTIQNQRARTARKGREILQHLEFSSQVPPSKFCGALKFGDDGEVLVAVQNGTLRIRPGNVKLDPIDEKHGFTIALPVRYNDSAVPCLFSRVLCESVPDPAEREVLLDVMATALIPDCRFEVALVLIGEAGTGKSTVIAPFPKIFGKTCAFLSMADICHPEGYKLATLQHKALNIGTELNALELEDSGLFKQLVSGEMFTARPIYGRPFEMASTATMVFLANSLPRFKNGTEAEVRRLRFVRFDYKPLRPDPTLKTKIEADAEGIFAELVRRASELIGDQPLAAQSEWGKRTMARFAITNDPVGQFVKQRCVVCPDKQATKELIFGEFNEFRTQYGLSDKLEENWFFRTLFDRFPMVRSKRVRIGDERTRIVVGIDIREEGRS
jgi:P4 family phage/plasmid primase-like protien